MVDPISSLSVSQIDARRTGTKSSEELMASAKAFEAAFVTEMLKTAGLGDAFGASEGVATDAMSSLVLENVASQIVDQGGFGLADEIYQQLAAINAAQGGYDE